MDSFRSIAHIDMDAFFAAIEQRDNPALRGKPVIVGADPKRGKGRGVVSTCSYEARRFGVHSAQPISLAWQKCPQGFFILPDMRKYSDVSRRVFEIFDEFTPDVEPVGIDEAFLDLTGTQGDPAETCLRLKKRIKEETGLTASAGLAPNKMAAKIASDLKKPDGLVVVHPRELRDFLTPLPIGKIWGLGRRAQARLNAMGVATIGELARLDAALLAREFGKTGLHYLALAQGADEREVVPETEAKSISNEITFERDTASRDEMKSALLALCEKVSSRLRAEKQCAAVVSIKVRLHGFETHTRARTLPEPAEFPAEIFGAAWALFCEFNPRRSVRLLGVKVSGLASASAAQGLFPDPRRKTSEKLYDAVDGIRGRFGYGAILPAGSIRKRRE